MQTVEWDSKLILPPKRRRAHLNFSGLTWQPQKETSLLCRFDFLSFLFLHTPVFSIFTIFSIFSPSTTPSSSTYYFFLDFLPLIFLSQSVPLCLTVPENPWRPQRSKSWHSINWYKLSQACYQMPGRLPCGNQCELSMKEKQGLQNTEHSEFTHSCVQVHMPAGRHKNPPTNMKLTMHVLREKPFSSEWNFPDTSLFVFPLESEKQNPSLSFFHHVWTFF